MCVQINFKLCEYKCLWVALYMCEHRCPQTPEEDTLDLELQEGVSHLTGVLGSQLCKSSGHSYPLTHLSALSLIFLTACKFLCFSHRLLAVMPLYGFQCELEKLKTFQVAGFIRSVNGHHLQIC